MAKNNETRFFYVVYANETWVFDQSNLVPGSCVTSSNIPTPEFLCFVKFLAIPNQRRGVSHGLP